MCHQVGQTGQIHTVREQCDRAACVIPRLLELQRAFKTAVRVRDAYIQENNQRMEAARFVKSLAESVEEIEPEVWKQAFRRSATDNTNATGYSDSYLRSDFEQIRRETDRVHAQATARSNDLISFFRRNEVQTHLARYHPDFDMIVAHALDGLHQTDAGLDFLAELWTERGVDGLNAVKATFDKYAAMDDLRESFDTLLTNITPAIAREIRQFVQEGNARSTSQVLNHARVKSRLDFFFSRVGVSPETVREALARRARWFETHLDRLLPISYDRPQLQTALEQIVNKAADSDEAPDIAKLSSDCSKMVLTFLSFSISTYVIVRDFKNASVSDRLAFAGEVLGQVGNIMEYVQEHHARALRTRPGWIGASVGIAVVGELVGVVVGLFTVAENISGGDYGLAALNAIATAASYVGLFAGVITAAGETMGVAATTIALAGTVAAVCVIIGLVIAAIIFFVTDHPLVNFLEDTHWGEDHIIPTRDTIDRYFTLDMFKIRMYMNPQNCLEISSPALDLSFPVHLKLNKNNRSMGTRVIDLRRENVDGKAVVRRGVGWNIPQRRTRTVIVERVWELWDDPDRDIDLRRQEADYSLYARLDPDRDGTMEITGEMSVDFPSVRARIDSWEFRGTSPGLDSRMAYPRDGIVRVCVKTNRDAREHRIQVLWRRNSEAWNTQTSRRVEENGTVIDETILQFSIPAVTAGEYDVTLHLKLFDASGRCVFTTEHDAAASGQRGAEFQVY